MRLLALRMEEEAMSQGMGKTVQAEKAKRRNTPQVSPEECSLATPGIQPNKTPLGLLTFRVVK